MEAIIEWAKQFIGISRPVFRVLQYIVGPLAVVLGFYAIRLARQTQGGLNEVTKLTMTINDIISGRSHFTKSSVYINHWSGHDKDVWHITDTLSIDKNYHDYFTKTTKRRGELNKITFFAPLELNKPVLVGAVIRKHLAPKVKIRHLSEEKVELLKRRWPFKTVISYGMILIGNQKIGSMRGCEFGHFSVRDPNPHYEFLVNIYKEGQIQNELTLEEWIIDKCEEQGIDSNNSNILREFLMSEEAINKYLEEYVEDYIIGRDAIDAAIKGLVKRLRKIRDSKVI